MKQMILRALHDALGNIESTSTVRWLIEYRAGPWAPIALQNLRMVRRSCFIQLRLPLLAWYCSPDYRSMDTPAVLPYRDTGTFQGKHCDLESSRIVLGKPAEVDLAYRVRELRLWTRDELGSRTLSYLTVQR